MTVPKQPRCLGGAEAVVEGIRFPGDDIASGASGRRALNLHHHALNDALAWDEPM